MPRKISSIAPGWWDYTTLDAGIIKEAAQLTPEITEITKCLAGFIAAEISSKTKLSC